MNTYSSTWIDTFLHTRDPKQTSKELEFLGNIIGDRKEVLDLCCGAGRHALGLAKMGYNVLGVDLDAKLVEHGQQQASIEGLGSSRFLKMDMREVHTLDQQFDAIIVMWQSFGYFDEQTNQSILEKLKLLLKPNGLLLLDIYNRYFSESHLGEYQAIPSRVTTYSSMENNRLEVKIHYENDQIDTFNWQVFYPEEISQIGKSTGFSSISIVAGFDKNKNPSPDIQRMQVIMYR